jgi:PqqD family protein of HPr-rel-A system
LIWKDWGDVFIVYQPSSTETHVFNDTTYFLLDALANGLLPLATLREKTAESLQTSIDELSLDEINFAVARLEELGLVEWQDGAASNL